MPFKSVLIFCISLSFLCCSEESDLIYIKPYANFADTSGAKIIWVTGKKALNTSVELSKNGKTVSTINPNEKLIKGDNFYHYTALLSNLKSNTQYQYIVTIDHQIVNGEFSTPPKVGEPLKFTIYGDVRGNPEGHNSVSKGIAKHSPQFVMCVGDLTVHGGKWPLWKKEFFDPAQPYLSKSVLWPVRGNHEKSGKNYKNLFDLPNNEFYYSFNSGDVHVVVLDSEGKKNEKKEMQIWLKEDLKNNTRKWSIALYHKPTFNVSGHESDWGRKKILPILEDAEVDLVLTGHSHLYERFVPIGPKGKKPIIHMVTGGGGAPFHEPKDTTSILALGKSIPVLHFIDFWVHQDTLRFWVKKPDGVMIDSLTIIKLENKYQSELMKQAITTQKAIELLD